MLPGLDEEEIERVKSLIKRTARLEFKMVVHESEYMRKLYKHIDTDPEAKRLGVEAEGVFELICGNPQGDAGFADLLATLCADRPRLLAMARAARDLAQPDAARRVAQHLPACVLLAHVVAPADLPACSPTGTKTWTSSFTVSTT